MRRNVHAADLRSVTGTRRHARQLAAAGDTGAARKAHGAARRTAGRVKDLQGQALRDAKLAWEV